MAILSEIDVTHLKEDSDDVLEFHIDNCKAMIFLSAKKRGRSLVNVYVDVLVILLTEKITRQLKGK